MFFILYASCCVTQFLLLLCQPYKALICFKLLPTGNPDFKKITTETPLLTSVVFFSTLIPKEQKTSPKSFRKNKKFSFIDPLQITWFFNVSRLISFINIFHVSSHYNCSEVSTLNNHTDSWLTAIMWSNYKSVFMVWMTNYMTILVRWNPQKIFPRSEFSR